MLGRFENFEDCICDRYKSKVLEPVKITNTRTALRCVDCKGVIGWWDDLPEKVERRGKIRPAKRKWTESELFRMR